MEERGRINVLRISYGSKIMDYDMNVRYNRYSGLGRKYESDIVIFENDNWYVCIREEETRFFYKQQCEHEGDLFMGFGELNQDVVPSGFIRMIEEMATEISTLKGKINV